jgi:oligopeptide transport system permease protein
MLRLIVFRLCQLPLILVVIFLVTFTLAWWIPGNPLEGPEGRRPSPAVIKQMEDQYPHLYDPGLFLLEYLDGVRKLDFGPSMANENLTVNEIIAAGLPVSVVLGAAAIVMALFIGVVAGVIGALKPGSLLDGASLGVALIGVSLPTFVTGAILLVVFAGLWRLAPIGAWDWPGYAFWTGAFWQDTAAMLRHMFLPALTLALAPAAYIARLIRLGLADVMTSDFIRTARAKGLSTHRALFDHALKVTFLPVLSFLGPAAAAAMTGSFVVEKVFNIPGLGQDFVNAVLNNDRFLILGLVLTYSTILIVFNLLVDIAYAWVDPRIQVS